MRKQGAGKERGTKRQARGNNHTFPSFGVRVVATAARSADLGTNDFALKLQKQIIQHFIHSSSVLYKKYVGNAIHLNYWVESRWKLK